MFLLFSKWNRMSFIPKQFIYDMTWDEGKTFLLRDHVREAQQAGLDVRWLFSSIAIMEYLHEIEGGSCLKKRGDI